jgi:membrane protein DedA with SNARE-associated domain
LFLARFVPIGRPPVYFFAGATSIPFFKFLTFEGLGAFCSASLNFGLGFFFSAQLQSVADAFASYQTLMLALVLRGGVIVLCRQWSHSRFASYDWG